MNRRGGGGIVKSGQPALRNEDVYPPPPPLRKKRGRRYASLRKCETDVDDYFVDTSDEEGWPYCTDRRRNDDEDTSSQSMSTGLTECGITVGDDSDDDFFHNNEWPIRENTVIPRKAAGNVNRTVRNGTNNRGHCSVPESENDTTSDENSGPNDRPFTKLTTTGAGIEIDTLGVDYAKCGEIPVTELIPVGVVDTDEHLVMTVSTITADVSGLVTSLYSDTDINDSPVVQEYVCPERRRRDDLSAYVNTQLLVKNCRRKMTVCCFGLCGMTDRLNRLELGWCWDCVDRLVWGYRVSCLVAIVTKNRSLGIDLFTEDRRVYASRLGLVGDTVRLYDVIPVYMWMKENFKGGLNKVMLMNKAPVDRRYHQRGGDNRQVKRTRASVNNRPIRVWGRFGCLYSPVRDADWSDVLSVGVSPVGKDVWIEYIGDGFSQCQSSDAAPLTELRDLYTLLHIYSDCATRLNLIWTFCVTVRISICVEEVTRCGGDLSVCRTMDGAALADDRSGVTFTAELCMPWDAPEAVIDIESSDLVSLGSFPDKVGLFGRRKDAAVSRIMAGRDSRSVRFVVPDGRVVDRGYHDVTVVDMEEEREPMVVMNDMTRLRELWPVEVFDHMKWYQQELELLRKSAKKEYSQTRPMPCRFCGKVICVDMYRHVARLHLDLVQLRRCPIAWCTTWKGSPQDCLEHVRTSLEHVRTIL